MSKNAFSVYGNFIFRSHFHVSISSVSSIFKSARRSRLSPRRICNVVQERSRPHTCRISRRKGSSQDELLFIGEQNCQDPRKICEGLIRSKERKSEGGVWAIKSRNDKGSERTRRRGRRATVPHDGGSKEIEMRSRHFVTSLSILFRFYLSFFLLLPPPPPASRFSS